MGKPMYRRTGLPPTVGGLLRSGMGTRLWRVLAVAPSGAVQCTYLGYCLATAVHPGPYPQPQVPQVPLHYPNALGGVTTCMGWPYSVYVAPAYVAQCAAWRAACYKLPPVWYPAKRARTAWVAARHVGSWAARRPCVAVQPPKGAPC
jgi:hypothetical protein